MARFAGDYFGIALSPEKDSGSELLKYYPELAQVKKDRQKTAFDSFERDQMRYNAPKTPEAFGGFRLFEKKEKGQEKAPPSFGGIPTFDVRY